MVFKSNIKNGINKNEVDLVNIDTIAKIGKVNGATTPIVHVDSIIIPLKIVFFKDMLFFYYLFFFI